MEDREINALHMNLSCFIKILLLSLAFTSFAMAIDLPPSLKPFYEKQGVEFGVLTQPDEGGQGARFAEFVKENWQAIAQEFDTFAPSLRQQALVALAAELLPPRTYISFVGLVCDKIAAGKVSPDIINTFLNSKGPKNGFFDVNFSDPEVRALVTRFKQLIPLSNTDLHQVLDGIESGEAKTAFYAWQELEPGPPPQLLGPKDSPDHKGANGDASVSGLQAPAPATPTINPASKATPTASAGQTQSLPLVLLCILAVVALAVWAAAFFKRRRLK